MNQFFTLQLLKQSIFLKSIECFAERLMIEKHTKYYCSYKNIKKDFYLRNHNQETEGKWSVGFHAK